MLTIEANNSRLTQILDDVSKKSGMILEGDVKDSRVYGNYGPQDPSAVLSELLVGLGYNIMIVGGANDDAPRKLILSHRDGGPTPALPIKTTEPVPPVRMQDPQFGLGAITHPPPPPSDDPDVRVQQNMRKLQQMRDPHDKQGAPP